jgi:two-component system CheB/CheR fusion protein
VARENRSRAIAVVLSGSGSDGSLGLADIKGEGGVAIAQAPSEAEYDAMPVAAMATDRVDFVLPVAEIAQKLLDLWENAQRIELPSAEAISLETEPPKGTDAVSRAESALREVMTTLLERTGHDFRTYKRGTVLRRLERRMQVTQQSDVPAYLDYLKGNLYETDALLQDMLITVTSFFRDRDAFEALEREVAAAILDRRPGGAHSRMERGLRDGRGSLFVGNAPQRSSASRANAGYDPGVRLRHRCTLARRRAIRRVSGGHCQRRVDHAVAQVFRQKRRSVPCQAIAA